MQISRSVGILFLLVFVFAVGFRFIHAQDIVESNLKCPDEYFLHSNGLCYPKVRKPCPFESESTSSTVSSTTNGITQAPLNIKRMDCPDGSIMVNNKCRKVMCYLGEYYRGTCLHPVCPQGLVWREKRCQMPGYITTIIEIDNVLLNEVNEKPIAVKTSDVNEVVYHTSATTLKPLTTSRSFLLARATQNPNNLKPLTTTVHVFRNLQDDVVCCKVFSPRICKLYATKWICFNRKYHRCDSHICKASVIYLKPPEIKYEPPMLVMPPNPQLDPCVTYNCYNDSFGVDCSGCADLRSENCSPHCYRYICPVNSCTYIDLYEYCNIYPGQDGCLATDGCLWKWCKV